MNHTQNRSKTETRKQLSASRKHWNHILQVTDRPRPDAPSLTQTIIVQMVYFEKFQSQTSFSFKLTTYHARGSIGESTCCWPTFGYSMLPETRYYTLVAWHALSEVRVPQFGGLCLVFNDHVWATKFPTAQEEEGEKSWSFLVIVAFTTRNIAVKIKRPAFCLECR